MLPLEPPKFTLKDIRDAIPSHCFQRNLYTSLSHLASDVAIVSVLAYLASWIGHPALPAWSQYVLWPLYWYAQGAVCTGVWVLAHECGHQSFSESELANNIVGTVCHSLLLVPYHSWRITHGKHHNNTGSCENDEVFAPATRSDWANEMLRETPIAQAWGIFVMLSVGWMPGYLVFNGVWRGVLWLSSVFCTPLTFRLFIVPPKQPPARPSTVAKTPTTSPRRPCSSSRRSTG